MTLSWRPRWRSSLISPARDARAAGGRAAARGRRGGLGRGPLHARARPAQPRTQDALGVDEVGEHAARALDGDCKGGRQAASESTRREMARSRETGHETEGARESRSEKRARSSPRRASKRPRAKTAASPRVRVNVSSALATSPYAPRPIGLRFCSKHKVGEEGVGGVWGEHHVDIHARVFPIFHRVGIFAGRGRNPWQRRRPRRPRPAARSPEAPLACVPCTASRR